MPAKTLEARLDAELEAIVIGTQWMRQGDDPNPPAERLAWIIACATAAQEIQWKIEARDRRKARAHA